MHPLLPIVLVAVPLAHLTITLALARRGPHPLDGGVAVARLAGYVGGVSGLFFGGMAAFMIPGLPAIASRLFCGPGDTFRSLGTGRRGVGLYCVDASGVLGEAHSILGFILYFDLFLLLGTLAVVLLARRDRRRRQRARSV